MHYSNVSDTVRPRLTLPPDWRWKKSNEMTTEALDFVLMTTQVENIEPAVRTSVKPPKTKRTKQTKSIATVVEFSFIVILGLLWV